MSLMDDPQVAANVARLAAETGIPLREYEQWAATASTPPPGICPHAWADAIADRIRHHQPWPERSLALAQRMTATTPRASEAA